MKYNSFLEEHRDITMSGTKRFEDKSGEYYLKNAIKYQRNNLNYLNQKSLTKPSLNNNKNSNNNKLIKVNKNKLYEELVPIPKIKQKNKLKCDYDKKNLNNAINNAKYIRRIQYSKNLTQQKNLQYKEMQINEMIFLKKIKSIQIWWKTIFQIIKLQKIIRGSLYRRKIFKKIKKQEIIIEKVINMLKVIKKVFWKKYVLLDIMNIKPGIKYYLNKWRDIIFKKMIVNEIKYIKYLNNETIQDLEYNSDIDNQDITTRSYNKLNHGKEQIKINLKKNNKNVNFNSIDSHKNGELNNKKPSLPLLANKKSDANTLLLEMETSSSSKIIFKNNNNKNKNKNINKSDEKRINNKKINKMKSYRDHKKVKSNTNIDITNNKKASNSHMVKNENKNNHINIIFNLKQNINKNNTNINVHKPKKDSKVKKKKVY